MSRQYFFKIALQMMRVFLTLIFFCSTLCFATKDTETKTKTSPNLVKCIQHCRQYNQNNLQACIENCVQMHPPTIENI
jgi:hypothetical protein